MSSNTGKRKPSQNDLRLLMNQKKRKYLENCINRKIDSPIAKYQQDGTLLCILCNTIVKNESIWNIHLHCKQHRENIGRKKQISEHKNILLTSQTTTVINPAVKRKVDHISSSSEPKKIKGILKNKIVNDANIGCTSLSNDSCLPSPVEITSAGTTFQMEIDSEDDAIQVDANVGLPEGFFDDPKQDAKARNVEYKDPIEEEWEKFQREIREQTAVSTQLQEDDQEESSAGRILEEIDEQLHNWSRMLSLEIKKEKLQETRNQVVKDEDDDSSYGSEEEYEEFLDWRSKSSFI